MAYQMVFYAGAIDKIQTEITAGNIVHPAYCFIRNSEDATVGQLGFVDKGNVLKLIKGENKKQVINVETLPEVENGDKDILYVYQGIVYVFDGIEYKPQYVDHTSTIEVLDAKITELSGKVARFEESNANIIERVETLEKTTGGTFIELD